MVQYTLWNNTVDLALSKDTFPTSDEMREWDDYFDGTGITLEHGYFTGSPRHSYKLHYRKFIPSDKTKVRGIYVFQHGIMAEGALGCKLDGELFKIPFLVSMLSEAGYIVYSLDMLGHGFSEGIRFFIPDFDWTVNRDDLASFAMFASKEETPGLPLFLGGESYGACLAIHVSRKWIEDPESGPTNYRGMGIFSPAIFGDVPPAPVVAFLTSLAHGFPTWTPFFMPDIVSPERIWRNENVRAELTSDRREEMGIAGGSRKFCLGTAVSLLRALTSVEKEVVPGLTTPFFVTHGTNDAGVPVGGTKYLSEKAATLEEDKCVKIIEGGFHDLLSEDNRKEIVGALVDWMDSRI